jgi:pimeloyl-ACP methyl ester carboxylesterase
VAGMSTIEVPVDQPEPTRARYPDREGYAQRDGVRLFWEVYGEGNPTILLVPCVAAVHSRGWKGQIPYLARHFRVVAFDPRGRGKSGRPEGPEAYRAEEHARDVLEVMRATGTDDALLVSDCIGSRPALRLLTDHGDRFTGAVFIAPYLVLTKWPPCDVMWRTFEMENRARRVFEVLRGSMATIPLLPRSPTLRRFARQVKWFEGDRMFNVDSWLNSQRDFLEWNARVLELTEPHSTRLIEDALRWGMQTDSRTMTDSLLGLDIHAEAFQDRRAVRELCERVRCPVLVIHGEEDLACPIEWGRELAVATSGSLLPIERAAHLPQARRPVQVNLALRDFAQRCAGTPTPERRQAAAVP